MSLHMIRLILLLGAAALGLRDLSAIRTKYSTAAGIAERSSATGSVRLKSENNGGLIRPPDTAPSSPRTFR
jgi:hypothetical protein